MKPTHRPKGSMCTACTHNSRDCSGLDFRSMPVMYREDKDIIVRCTEFEQKPQEEKKQ